MLKFKNVFLFGFLAVFVAGSLLVTEKADAGFFGNLFRAKKNGNNSSSQQAKVSESKSEIQAQFAESGTVAGVSIIKKGDKFNVNASGATVKEVGVNNGEYTITAEANFGSSVLRWTLKATASGTKVTRLYGAPSALSEISVGNNLSFAGLLDATKSSFTVNATEIKNFSVQRADARYNGAITEINAEGKFFMLKDTRVVGDIKVIVGLDTKIESRILEEQTNAPKHEITFADLKVGMIVFNAEGVVDMTKVPVELKAKQIVIVPKDNQQKEGYQTGTIESIGGKNLPTSMRILSTGGKIFTVNMNSGTAFATWKGHWKDTNGVEGSGAFGSLKIKDSVWVDGTIVIKTGMINATKVWQQIK